MSKREMDRAMREKYMRRIKSSDWWNTSVKTSGTAVQNGTCFECGQRSAWFYLQNPWVSICNRKNKCGAIVRFDEALPDLKQNFDTDFKPTKADPHRPAREYLLNRGIPESLLKGLDFWYLANARNTGSGAVMFVVGKDAQGNTVSNGRLFNPPAGEGKTHNTGSTAGLYWRHPGFTYDPNQPVWITEGIIDALSLLAMGMQAIAVLAAGQDPAKIDLTEFRQKVLAFDNDEAGRAACRKWNNA